MRRLAIATAMSHWSDTLNTMPGLSTDPNELAELFESLSIATGMASGDQGASLEELMTQADARMYENKHDHYSRTGIDRRRT